MDEYYKTPRNQPDGGWQVVRSREEGYVGKKKESESLSGWRLEARPGVLDFGFIGW